VLVLVEMVILLVSRVNGAQAVGLAEGAWVITEGARLVALGHLVSVAALAHSTRRAVAEVVRFFIIVVLSFLLHYNLMASGGDASLEVLSSLGCPLALLAGHVAHIDGFVVIVGGGRAGALVLADRLVP